MLQKYFFLFANPHFFLQDFHDQSQKLILWLASAEGRRNEAQITDPNADPHTILESQKELMVSGDYSISLLPVNQ